MNLGRRLLRVIECRRARFTIGVLHVVVLAAVTQVPLSAKAAPPVSAQSSTNFVLELDGTESYLELPTNIFNNLTQATVEAWVRWDRYGEAKRLFNYGGPRQDMSILLDGKALTFVLGNEKRELHYITIPELLRTNEWCHVAGVSGPGGMQLYFNGFLMDSNSFTGRFSRLATNGYFYLGERVTTVDAPTLFQGGIDEFRVWNTARTEQQIRETMFRRLNGNEPGLVGCWNFDDGTPQDSSPGQHHGTLIGSGAKIAPGRAD